MQQVIHDHKIKVGVLMGGKSIEKEVSFNSGRTICDHLDTGNYQVIPLFQASDRFLYILPEHFLHRGKISDFEHRLSLEAQRVPWSNLKTIVDFVYIAQHGRYGEDGCLQGLLEILGIPYFGSKVFASALGMNKSVQKVFLRAAGMSVPHGATLAPHKFIECDSAFLAKHEIFFPLIVKPQQEGSSFGVSLVRSEVELQHALYTAARITPGILQSVLIEECIEGLEFTCIVLTDYRNNILLPLPPTEIEHMQPHMVFDYEQKYMPGRAIKHTPARCTDEQIAMIKQASVVAMQALGITNCARIDGFLTPDNRIVIIDPNTFSGMAPSSFAFLQAAEVNMSHTQLINHLIATELHMYGFQNTVFEEKEKMEQSSKLRIGVLMGGRSNEREISLESGRNITYKLSPHKYDAIPLFVDSKFELYKINQKLLVYGSTQEIEQSLVLDMYVSWDDLAQLVDFVFIGLHGGEGENGSVQGALEMLGIPYNGSSVLASALCMDKFKTTAFLRNLGFEVPKSLLISHVQFLEVGLVLPEGLKYPVIIKPHDDGCSVLVQKAYNDQELHAALHEIFAHNKQYAMVEECIIGMELTVGVLGNDKPFALPPSQAVTNKEILTLEEKFLPGAGENQTPAPLPIETLALVRKTIEQVYLAVGCKGYARIDCFYQTALQSPTGVERVIILEINSLPGMTPATCIFHQAAELGIKPMDFVDKIIALGLEAHKNFETTSFCHVERKDGVIS